MEMSERIKQQRLLKGYTQEELAFKLGLQKSAIAKYENGRVENIKRSVISKMAEILECSPAYLMGWSDSVNGAGNYNVYMDIKASSKNEAIYTAVKNMLIANGDTKAASTLTEDDALKLYEMSGFEAIQITEEPKTIAAHKDGDNFTPEELEKIEEYKKLLLAARPKD